MRARRGTGGRPASTSRPAGHLLRRSLENSVILEWGDVDGRCYADHVCGPGKGVLSLEAWDRLAGLLREPAGSVVGGNALQVVLPAV